MSRKSLGDPCPQSIRRGFPSPRCDPSFEIFPVRFGPSSKSRSRPGFRSLRSPSMCREYAGLPDAARFMAEFIPGARTCDFGAQPSVCFVAPTARDRQQSPQDKGLLSLLPACDNSACEGTSRIRGWRGSVTHTGLCGSNSKVRFSPVRAAFGQTTYCGS